MDGSCAGRLVSISLSRSRREDDCDCQITNCYLGDDMNCVVMMLFEFE